MSVDPRAGEIDTGQICRLIEKNGPPLSPMLIFSLLDEIDRLRTLLAQHAAKSLADENAADEAAERAERAEAEIDRLRCKDPDWCGGRCNCTTDGGLLHRAILAEAALARVEALCDVVESRMMRTAKPDDIRAAITRGGNVSDPSATSATTERDKRRDHEHQGHPADHPGRIAFLPVPHDRAETHRSDHAEDHPPRDAQEPVQTGVEPLGLAEVGGGHSALHTRAARIPGSSVRTEPHRPTVPTPGGDTEEGT